MQHFTVAFQENHKIKWGSKSTLPLFELILKWSKGLTALVSFIFLHTAGLMTSDEYSYLMKSTFVVVENGFAFLETSLNILLEHSVWMKGRKPGMNQSFKGIREAEHRSYQSHEWCFTVLFSVVFWPLVMNLGFFQVIMNIKTFQLSQNTRISSLIYK